MKHAANLLSLSRLLLVPLAVAFYRQPAVFYPLYLLGGLTDILDGIVARKTGTQSTLGARLDTLGDIMLCAGICLVLWLWVGASLTPFLWWAAAIALMRLLVSALARVKYGRWASIHTIGNKLTGFCLFALPFAVPAGKLLAPALFFVCLLATLSAAEEALIHIRSAHLYLNRRGLWDQSRPIK